MTKIRFRSGDDEWKFKDGHVMLMNGIDSRSGDVVVLENDGDFEGVLGAMGFGNLQQVELLQNLMRIRDMDWVSLDAIEASSIGRSGDVVVLENDGDFEGVLGATGFGNLQQVELLQNLMRIRDVDWVSLDAIEASSIGRFVFVADFEIEGGRLLF
ncbi:hypothetical protein F0562_019781 [Nyssa sinensis]|uniref:Uncharacterized protein n=1 Tax=Nyssa sinensis TaxID=561372 RepID=A0A5J5BTD6_9ASTE|nr:hypothetical protein F0562_019781 [Nyssa sinensis]